MAFEQNEISIKSNGGTELQARLLAEVIPAELLDNFQIISSRPRELDPTKIRIMFFHDLPGDPEAQKFKEKSFRDKFHHFVFISDWQQWGFARELGFPLTLKNSTIEVGFKPIEVNWEDKAVVNKIKYCYTSTPQRGLDILVPVFEAFSKQFDDVELDVFSSFSIYGWDKMDEQYQGLYNQIISNPNMNYRGYVPHAELIDYLKGAHVFAYPCTWPETSCKAMEEAMSAGLICIHPNFAALPSTSGGLNMMYQWDDNKNNHAQIFFNELIKAREFIVNVPEFSNYLKHVKFYADNRYDIERIGGIWTKLLGELLKKYPTPESRAIMNSDDLIIFDTNAGLR